MASQATEEGLAAERRKRRVQAWERDLRLWSGLALMAFLLTHLLNHAVGIFGLEAMQQGQDWSQVVWRSWPGQAALYGAALVHLALTLKRISGRRTLRMPRDEMLQIVLGLVIPLLAIEHVVNTRAMVAAFGGEHDTYLMTLPRIFAKRPWIQTALVIVAWTHGCVGFHHAFRWRRWYVDYRQAFLIAAILAPVLALAGFVVGSREAMLQLDPAGEPGEAAFAWLRFVSDRLHWAYLAALGLTLAVILARVWRRRRGGLFTIRYTGHGAVRMSRGGSILEASRINGIPHPSRCGGRARCATCRVLVVRSDAALPAPTKAERALLTRIDAPPQVRLGCQLRPGGDVSVQILLPFLANLEHHETEADAFRWGVEHVITVLFVNMRGFNLLAQKQYPQDLVLLLNRFTAEMTQAVEAHGGRVTTHLTDGMMAIFGLDGRKDAGSAAAIGAARDMLKATRALDSELADVLSIPLRVGIGIHTGPAVVARFGGKERGQMVGALGETVSIADRLESATKTLLADCLISADTLKACGGHVDTAGAREIHMPGRDAPLIAHALKEAELEPQAA